MSLLRGRVLALTALACAASLGIGGQIASAGQQRPSPPRDDGLLERFPIGTTPVATNPAGTAPAAPRRAPATTERSSQESFDSLQLGLVAGAGALALAGAFAAWRVRRSRRDPRQVAAAGLVPTFPLALANRECDGADSVSTPPPTRPGRRSRSVNEVSQHRQDGESRPAGTEQRADGRETDYAGVGERVTGILEAAESAAAQMRAEAVAAVAEIHNSARAEAAAEVHRAEEDAARVRSEADTSASEARSAAESFGARQRREAETEAQQLLSEAETQARATRQAAEEMARQIEAAAQERSETLRAQLEPLEAKLRRARDGFRGLASQLDELLETQRGSGESLVDALGATARQAAPREERV